MDQISFADVEYAGKRKKTRREVFMEEMEPVVPWNALLKLIEPHFPVAGRGPHALPTGVDPDGELDSELVCAERLGDGTFPWGCSRKYLFFESWTAIRWHISTKVQSVTLDLPA